MPRARRRPHGGPSSDRGRVIENAAGVDRAPDLGRARFSRGGRARAPFGQHVQKVVDVDTAAVEVAARSHVAPLGKQQEKVVDVVGLYMNPPDKAMVLCVDEKSQIQALDRTQPGLQMKKGRAATMTHDYKRHGTTTLFAVLDVKTGIVIGECQSRHRAKEFIRFLKKIDRAVRKGIELHLIIDNYATHKTAAVKAWLAKHPRFTVHFIPTSSSCWATWFIEAVTRADICPYLPNLRPVTASGQPSAITSIASCGIPGTWDRRPGLRSSCGAGCTPKPG